VPGVEGVFAGKPVAGVTIITRDNRGAITSVRLYHRPFDQVVAFARRFRGISAEARQQSLCLHVVSRVLNHTQGATDVPRYARNQPYSISRKPAASDFAYRRFGRRGGTPLLLLGYFTANLDRWDPKVTNGFAAEREVILVDYPGIGGSSVETPSTVAALTKACVEFCGALGLTRFDVLRFSLGGMIALATRRRSSRHGPAHHSYGDGTARRGRDGLRGALGRRAGRRSRLDHERVLYAKRAE